jgi:murein DD-endopeptidase MepM/ murein hydrolase activator NlpD
MKASRGYMIMLHRDGALESRQLRVAGWVARLALIAGSTFVIGLILVTALYGPTVRAAARTPLLDREVARLKAENARVMVLARRLDEVEARYAQLRGMLGPKVGLPGTPPPGATTRSPAEEQLYVAPAILAILARLPAPGDSAASDGPSLPNRWPLRVRSYRTRGLALGDAATERHAGLDLAVPVGSDVRAAGGGRVKQTGTDSAYGVFVLLQHPGGYQTMYGHLSRAVVQQGAMVRSGQVIGLSGSTGRSTAPHLHFEIRRGGQSLDPLTMVREGT